MPSLPQCETSRPHDMRVLVVAPTGQDGALICNLLTSRGIPCVNFPTAEGARIEVTGGSRCRDIGGGSPGTARHQPVDSTDS